MELKTPLTWLREQDRNTQLELLAEVGRLDKLAKRLGCSEAALRPIYMGEPKQDLDWTQEFLLEQFERYRSVRFVAHIHRVNESLIRKEIEKHELELTDLIDYSFGANSNSKGRRAEIEFARLRGLNILDDKNKSQGSQAEYDFDDKILGKVNVKSSRRYRYKARTRRESPEFWKASLAGRTTAETFVFMCYDADMKELEGVKILKTTEMPNIASLTLTRADLVPIATLNEI